MLDKKGPVARELLGWVIDRRQILIKLGAFSITGAGTTTTGTTSASSTSAGTGGSGVGAAGGTGARGGDPLNLDPSLFEDAGSFSLTDDDIEGPFYIDDNEFPNDVRLFRSDIRDGHPGCEFQLYFRLLDARNGCQPIPEAEVYIWHCDADGYYSGFDGQDPSKPYTGVIERTPENDERFCRGVQLTNNDGIAGFRTIWPGWYAGRPVHVHLVARINREASRLINTQIYFPADLTKRIYESEPAYAARSTNIPPDSLNLQPTGIGGPTIQDLEYETGAGLVIGKLNLIVNG